MRTTAPFIRSANVPPYTNNRRHHPQPQRGRSQGAITDHGGGSGRAGGENSLPGTPGGRSGARTGNASRKIRRSLTTPSSIATAAKGGVDLTGGEGDKGERDAQRGERGQDGGRASGARKRSSGGVSSLATVSTQGGEGGELSTRQQRRGTLSSAGSDISSDGSETGPTPAGVALDARGEREGAAFAGDAHPQSRRGEDGLAKENGDEEEMSRIQPIEEVERGQTGGGTR